MASDYPFVSNLYAPNSLAGGSPTPVTITLIPEEHAPGRGDYRRHTQQLAALANLQLVELRSSEFPHTRTQLMPIMHRFQRFRLNASARPETFDGKDLLRDHIDLFNIIVVLEWSPSDATIQQLMEAFRSASDLLYDATNGYMAFGQVVFAESALMDVADIQIMASSRLHPRTWLNGFNDKTHFSPIRLGRGLWEKRQERIIPWYEAPGYRAIVHEWGHYALTLRDEYIDNSVKVVYDPHQPHRLVERLGRRRPEYTLLVPRVSLTLGGAMALADTDEIAPVQRKLGLKTSTTAEHLLNQLQTYFPGVDITGRASARSRRMPLPLPQFYCSVAFFNQTNADEYALPVDNLALSHCWLYTLRWNSQESKLERVTTQGSIDFWARNVLDQGRLVGHGTGYRLLGAEPGDHILAIGTTKAGQLQVWNGTLTARVAQVGGDSLPTESLEANWSVQWLPETLPVISVLPVKPVNHANWHHFSFRVRIEGGPTPDEIWVVPFNGPPASLRFSQLSANPALWESDVYDDSGHLDGMVVLQWGYGKEARFWVAEYTYGGHHQVNARTKSLPLNTRSAEGNMMLFSRSEGSTQKHQHEPIRVATTRNYTTSSAAPGAIKPRSYLYSLAISEMLPAEHRPTLVLYYDPNTLDSNGDLIIHRYTDGVFTPIPTYAPPGAFYAATPLTPEFAPGLAGPTAASSSRVEQFQLFLVP